MLVRGQSSGGAGGPGHVVVDPVDLGHRLVAAQPCRHTHNHVKGLKGPLKTWL